MYSTGSFLELLTAAVAWHLNEKLWLVLVNTGLAFLPFAAVVLICMRQAAERSAVGSPSGLIALQMAEQRLYPAFAVVLLALVPAVAISPAETVFAEQSCTLSRSDLTRTVQNHQNRPGQSGFDEARLDGVTARIPVWWWLLNNLGRGITAVAINALPCTVDLRRLTTDISETVIRSPQLRTEYMRFVNECWTPAYRLFLHRRDRQQVIGDRSVVDDIAWPGSRYFTETPGYYDSLYPRRGVRAFEYDVQRDMAFAGPDFAEDGGWPDCSDWWQSDDSGLRSRLLELIDAGLLGRWYHRFRRSAQSDDRLLYNLLRNDGELHHRVISDSLSAPGLGGLLREGTHNLLASAGVARELPSVAVVFKVVRDSAPIIQALVLMIFTAVMPLLLTAATYRIEKLVALSFIFLSVVFWSFLFKLVFWLDNTLTDALFQDGWLQQAVSLPLRVIFQSILFGTYIALPLAWTTWMSAIGGNLGSGIESLLQIRPAFTGQASAVSGQSGAAAGSGGRSTAPAGSGTAKSSGR